MRHGLAEPGRRADELLVTVRIRLRGEGEIMSKLPAPFFYATGAKLRLPQGFASIAARR